MYKNCIIWFVPIDGQKGWYRLTISQEGSNKFMQMPIKKHAETVKKVLKQWKEEK